MKKYDLIVIGAGPAGSMAAYYAAKNGLDVLLLEKHNQIGVPLCCAEAVTKTGLDNLITPKPNWIAQKIHAASVHVPNGDSFHLDHPDTGYILERKIFDRDLATMAVDAGAELKVSTEAIELVKDDNRFTTVVVLERGERKKYETELIVAADGVEGLIGRFAGLYKALKGKYYDTASQFLVSGINVEPSEIKFYFDPEKYPSGYLWVFPKSRTTANIGLGAEMINYQGVSQHQLLTDFCDQQFGSYSIAERTSGGIPSYQGEKALLKDNIMFVGDAGRVVDSLTGAGIINAMVSGKIAGETAYRFFQQGCKLSVLKEYVDTFLKVKGTELSTYLKARKVLSRMNSKDFSLAIQFLNSYFPDGYTTGVNGVKLVLGLVRFHPRFIWLAKDLIFS